MPPPPPPPPPGIPTSGRPWLAKLDMYRKVPGDLLEGSRQGSIISWMALLTMMTLFAMETKSYFTKSLVPHLVLDRNKAAIWDDANQDVKIRVDFNVTMMDLKCEYASIDVVSVWGKEQENVTKNIHKWTVDAQGVQKQYLERNMEQHDLTIELEDSLVTESLEQLEDDGQDAVDLDEDSLDDAIKDHEYVFVDFFAGWCSHCQRLAPTWETLAEIMYDTAHDYVESTHPHSANYTDEEYEEARRVELPVLIGKVDCVEHHNYCMAQAIRGYPTLRLFVRGEHYADYRGSRTIIDFIQFLHVVEERTATQEEREAILKAREAADDMNATKFQRAQNTALATLNVTDEHVGGKLEEARSKHSLHINDWDPGKHPGCQIAGNLLLNRVPGNFYIRAVSPHADLAPAMTNVSHVVHHLAFRPEISKEQQERNRRRRKELEAVLKDRVWPSRINSERMMPMEEHVYVTKAHHTAHHHYLKLVSTNEIAYQVLASSQLSYYGNQEVPEAKFILDLSPIAVNYKIQTRPWYDYITSLMAIIGGTFTVVGMLESTIRRVVEVSKRRTAPQVRQPPARPAMQQEQRQLHYGR